MEDFLKSAGIEERGRLYDDERYIIETSELAVLNKWFWNLSQCDEIAEASESSKVNSSIIKIKFENEDFEIELYGNVDEDDYKLTITKKDN